MEVFIATPGRCDGWQSEKKMARSIVNNIVAAYDNITGLVDETVILGLAPPSATPYVRDPLLALVEQDARPNPGFRFAVFLICLS